MREVVMSEYAGPDANMDVVDVSLIRQDLMT
jgi:hypothetical protein